ncbi:MAG: FumA C-terminus/TtdB family hydratase beta subunit [Candidatus Omnitrophota bacterium]|nr:FumA C-terminus/TtdB family hydratase beta subunit [Candidatus Omnitrophota bacterium]
MKKITNISFLDEHKSFLYGEHVFFSGMLYVARDQAHKKLVALLKKGKKIPFNSKGQIIYYCGPTQTPPGKAIGSCGPTTSSRMDQFVEPLLKAGLIAMIGKGRRSKKVRELIKKYKAVYFVAPAGCGAVLSRAVISKKLVAFGELGPEAIYRLEVKDFPLMVAIDSRGRSIYQDL